MIVHGGDEENYGADISAKQLKSGNEIHCSDSTVFRQLYPICTWEKRDNVISRVTLSIFLPSGVRQGGFVLLVINEKSTFEFMVKWAKSYDEFTSNAQEMVGRSNSAL